MIVIILLFIILILVGISKKQTNALSQVNILALRGICAFEIMIGHIGLATGSKWLYLNRKAGILFVGIFFMLSGYGLRYSLDTKTDYLNRFLINHFIKIFPIAYIVFLLGTLGCHLINGMPINRLWFISIKDFLSGANWYVGEILLLYLIYWLSYKFINKIIGKNIILGASLILILCCYFLKFDKPWYGSTICFWLGIVWYENEKKIIDKFSKNVMFYCLVGFIFISSMLLFMIDGNGIIGLVFARNMASAAFCVLIILILYNVKIGNKITNILGIESYALYLIHPWIITILKEFNFNLILFSWIIILGSIGVAFVLTYIMKLVDKRVRR